MTVRSGVLKSFNASTYTASVQLPGSLSVWLTGVPVARNIASAEMVSGRRVALVLFDDANPADAVVTAVWT